MHGNDAGIPRGPLSDSSEESDNPTVRESDRSPTGFRRDLTTQLRAVRKELIIY